MARRTRTKQSSDPIPAVAAPPAAGPAPPEILPPAPVDRRKRHLIAIASLALMVLLAYSNTFHNNLTYDSYHAVKDDPRIRAITPENTHLIWTQDYWYQTSASGLFRPLTTHSYQFNYAVLGNGQNPPGYHWFNLILHAVNVALLYWLALLVFEEFWPAFAMAALWALHPVLTEAVTNVVGRADEFACFGILAGLLCYLRSAQAAGWRKIAWLLAVLLVSAVGMFAKESSIVVLAIVPLYELAFAKGRVDWPSRIPGYIALVIPVAIYLEIRQGVISQLRALIIAFTDNNVMGADFLTSRLTAIKVIGKYLWLMLWPAHLSADYSFNQIPLFDWRLDAEGVKALFALVVCIALAAAALYCFRRARPVFFFVGFFFVALSPTSNLAIKIGSIMAERFLYVPSIGFAGCLAWAGWMGYRRLESRWSLAPQAAAVALGVICATYGVRTYARNSDWRTEYTLWESGVRNSPNSYRTHHDFAGELGNLPNNAGLDRAIEHWERSIAIVENEPMQNQVPPVYAALGMGYRTKGDLLAEKEFSKPGYDPRTNPWYQKSLEILLRGEKIDAVWNEVTQRANRAEGKHIGPAGTPPLYLALGRLYMRFNDAQKALDQFAYGRRMKPLPDFAEESANIYIALKQPDRAITALMEGLAADLTQVRLAAEVADLYRQYAPESCAISGSGLNLACPLVHQHICEASRNITMMYREMQWDEKISSTIGSAVQSLGCPAEMFR